MKSKIIASTKETAVIDALSHCHGDSSSSMHLTDSL